MQDCGNPEVVDCSPDFRRQIKEAEWLCGLASEGSQSDVGRYVLAGDQRCKMLRLMAVHL